MSLIVSEGLHLLRGGGRSVILLLVAVPHADALQAVTRLHRHRGLLHRQPVVDSLIALVVQRAVQDALQPEVTVGLLLRGGGGGRGGER